MNKEAARIAARWWADHLRNGSKMDNGDDSEIGVFTTALAIILQWDEIGGLDEGRIMEFENALADVIEKMEGGSWDYISVDYHPDEILSNAAKKAGINLGMASLPWKTHMSVRCNSITVSEGYRAPTVEIWHGGDQ